MPKFNDTTIYGDLTVTGKISGNTATTTESGLMSAADKDRLDDIETGAQVNTVTSVAGKIGPVVLDAGDISFDGIDTNYLTAKTEVEGAIKELDTIVKTNAEDLALKVNISDIVNNLTSTDTDKPLSANQGSVLQDTKEAIENKAIDFSVVDDMKYPTTKAVQDLVDAIPSGVDVSIWRY